MNYREFIENKSQLGGMYGFEPTFIPDMLFDFQKHLLDWSCRKGRAAIFADCGLGKTPMQLAWAENVVRKTNGRVLILTPLAVAAQTVEEGVKFGVECKQSRDGSLCSQIVVTNYEKLHMFNRNDFSGVVCDESSILKNFDGVTRAAVTEFMRIMPYRLLCTATAAPNDYIELGTSSEALGHLGFTDMVSMFFTKAKKTYSRSQENRSGLYRFRGHAERDFWRWVCGWARACRKPSDLGFCDNVFTLPSLTTREHVVKAAAAREGFLFDLPAVTLNEQRDERKRSKKERCEMAAELVDDGNPAVCWGYLNDECDMLERMIPDAVQVSGQDSDERKEEVFHGFKSGQARVLITKPAIGAWGLNWQHCAHQTFFPSHSFEQFYQCVRRCWRFGQKNPVVVDIVASEGEAGVMQSIERKADQANRMFSELVRLMNDELKLEKKQAKQEMEIPKWL